MKNLIRMKSLKNMLILMIFVIFLILFTLGCSRMALSSSPSADGKLIISTTLFPQYSFAKIIGGDLVEVQMIVPPGIESHSFEPTPRTITNLRNADLLLYTGQVMEPWMGDLIANLGDSKVEIMDLSEGITLLTEADEHNSEEENHEETDVSGEEDLHGDFDPHYWLDPDNAIIMVEHIRDAMIQNDPSNALHYSQNAETLIEDLGALDEAFVQYFSTVDHPKLVYGGHFAFGYFAAKYHVDYISPFTGFSPNAEPKPKQITAIIDYIEANSIKTVFYEELLSPKIAQVIAEETGAKMLILNGVHNVTQEQIDDGETYISLMYQNLENLRLGLSEE